MLCLNCLAAIEKELDRLTGGLVKQLEKERLDNKRLWEVNRSLEMQRAGLLRLIEAVGVEGQGETDHQTLRLPYGG